ncbi:MAG: polymer-forming cytoskeletal protein [Deltaproteobacteria bacterium]
MDRGEERLLSCPRGRHATSTDTASTEAKEAPTVVAPGTSVEGDVHGPGDLVVQGNLRGRASMGGTVRIEAGSTVRADIRAPRVVIEDGASFQGMVDTSGA